MATIKSAAKLVGKAEMTLHRWRRTNPELFQAVMEYAERRWREDRIDTPDPKR